MAGEYIAKGGERLYELADGADPDIFMQAFAREAGEEWRGQGVLAPTERVTLPLNPQPFMPTQDTPKDILDLKNILDAPPEAEHVRPAEIFIDADTGNEIGLDAAIPYEVVNRFLTYRPQRWMRPEYGTKMIEVFNHFVTPELLSEIERVAILSQAPASPRYELNVLSVQVDEGLGNRILVDMLTTREVEVILEPTGLEVNLA